MEPRIQEERNKKIKAKEESQCQYFPEEITSRIISELPVKSLLRFKCVSKSWCSLISDPKFTLSTQRQQIVIISSKKRVGYRPIHLIDNEGSVIELHRPDLFTQHRKGKFSHVGPKIRGSCNGLLLVSVGDDLFLWNPLTRWCNKVFSNFRPRPGEGDRHYKIKSGLFYDSSTEDYKVLMASDCVMVGSTKNKTWTQIHFPYNREAVKSGPIVNERLHWLVTDDTRTDISSQPRPYLIVCFDPENNEFVKVPMPLLEQRKGNWIEGLGVLDGCLSMALFKHSNLCTAQGDVEVFAMQKYGDETSWTSLFVLVDLIELSPLHNSSMLLCYTKDGEVVVQWGKRIYALQPDKPYWYYFPNIKISCFSSASTFVGSLASPA